MHYVPSKYEKIGSILQNRTEINHSRDVLEGRDLPQDYDPPTGYVPDDYEFKGVNHAQLALEIPDNWWQNVGVAEGHENEDNLPRLMFRGIPSDEAAGASSAANYHYMARQDEFKGLREAFRYHDKDCRRHVPFITPGDYPENINQGRSFLVAGDACEAHPGYGGYHPVWGRLVPRDLPIYGTMPINYDRQTGEIWHSPQSPLNSPLSPHQMYNDITVDSTGHVTHVTWRDLHTLLPGDGLLGNYYNTSASETWKVDFLPAYGNNYNNGHEITVARSDHLHDGRYSHVDHNHNGVYAPVNHTHPEINSCNCEDGGGGGEFDGSDYVLKAGDTMTGTLKLQAQLWIGGDNSAPGARITQNYIQAAGLEYYVSCNNSSIHIGQYTTPGESTPKPGIRFDCEMVEMAAIGTYSYVEFTENKITWWKRGTQNGSMRIRFESGHAYLETWVGTYWDTVPWN